MRDDTKAPKTNIEQRFIQVSGYGIYRHIAFMNGVWRDVGDPTISWIEEAPGMWVCRTRLGVIRATSADA